jgi:hypothetical protein
MNGGASALRIQTMRHGLVQRLRTVEDHEETAIRPQAAALEIGQEALTDGRILR